MASRIPRPLSILAVALAVAALLTVGPTTASRLTGRNLPGVAQAHACNWDLIAGYGSGIVGDWSGHAQVDIFLMSDHCGTFRYQSAVYSVDGSNPVWVVVTVRAWRCYSYYSQTMVSGPYWQATPPLTVPGNGGCSAHADTYGTMFQMPSGNWYRVYAHI